MNRSGTPRSDLAAVDPVPGSVSVFRNGAWSDLGYFLIASGYLVHRRQVLLVYHNRFKLWVPPGGHLEAGETFAQAATREFAEETGIAVEAISAGPQVRDADTNATPEALPFYVDVEREGFAKPALVQFYYVRATGSLTVRPQLSEVDDCQWFKSEDLEQLPTFNQVRQLSLYSLRAHPDANT